MHAKEHGILPLDFEIKKGVIPEVIENQYQEAAHRLMEIVGYDSGPVEDNLWELFGFSFSSAVRRVLAENEGIVIPLNYELGIFYYSPYSPNLLPKAVGILSEASFRFARGFTYILDPDHCGSLRDEQFRSVLEKCLVLSQEIGDFYGRELIRKKAKLGINMELLQACIVERVDYSKIEELLKQGAEPLGYIEENGFPNNLYDSVIENLAWKEDKNGDLVKITDLFLQYGLDISKPAIPYDNNEILNPIYNFCGYMRGSMMETLRLLLDHGLTAEDAEWGWGQQLDDFLNVSDSLDCEDVRGELPHYVWKLMLTASYPHVLNRDEGLRYNIWYDRNHYDLSRFREWDWYDFELDTSHCDKGYPRVARSIVTIKDKSTGEKVWRFGVEMDPEIIYGFSE